MTKGNFSQLHLRNKVSIEAGRSQLKLCNEQVTYFSNGGSKGSAPHGPKRSQFHAVFLWQNRTLASLGGSAPLPTGNPGSAPVFPIFIVSTSKVV